MDHIYFFISPGVNAWARENHYDANLGFWYILIKYLSTNLYFFRKEKMSILDHDVDQVDHDL